MNLRNLVPTKKRSGKKLLFQIPAVQDERKSYSYEHLSPFYESKKPDIRNSDDLATIQSSLLSSKISSYSGLARNSQARSHRSNKSRHFQTAQEWQSADNESDCYGTHEAKRLYTLTGEMVCPRKHHQYQEKHPFMTQNGAQTSNSDKW